jgi:hypothetical protein
MNQLGELYCTLLQFGFISLREAILSKDYAWAEKEVEFLHNIPTLVDETNLERHRCFWFNERDLYIQWVNTRGSDEPRSRMRTFYEPVWRGMEPILLEAFSRAPVTLQVPTDAAAETGTGPVLS